MQVEQIETAFAFQLFMEEIWSGLCEPSENGVMIYQHRDYDTYHDAIKTVRKTCARRTGGSNLGGEDAHVYRFPDDSAVVIGKNGAGLRLSRHRFTGRKQTA